jgi:hypothetical protein
MNAKWFVATIILKCEIAGTPTIPDEWTCSQQIFVIRANNRETAFEKAQEIGNSQETSYLNVDGSDVTWKFVGLENLEEVVGKVIRNGTEIWGRIFHTENPDALVVEKEGLSVFYNDEIRNLSSEQILVNGQGTKLVCNRKRNN